MNKLKISIITPCYNSANYLQELWDSIKSQSYDNWEWIVCDDQSKDDSYNLLIELTRNDPRVRLFQMAENGGPAKARNFGIEKASGEIITFIDSDDTWKHKFLETMLQEIQAGKEFVFSSYHRFIENDTQIVADFIVPESVSYKDILKTCSISCLTAMIDIRRAGKFYMLEKWREDYSLWLQYLKVIPRAYGVKEPLATYRMRHNSFSRNKFKIAQQQWKMYVYYEKLGIFRSIYYFANYILASLRKYKL